jgi:hypothetical protein
MTTKHITTRAVSYDSPTTRRRQLSSGPLGGDNQQSLVAFVAPKLYVSYRFIGVQRATLLVTATKYSMNSSSIIRSLHGQYCSSGKQAFYESSVSVRFRNSLVIERALISNTQHKLSETSVG